MNLRGMSHLKGNLAALFVLQISNYIFPLVTLPYLTRKLGLESYGLLVFSQAIMQYFVVLIDYGFSYSATHQVTLHRGNKLRLAETFWSTQCAKAIIVLLSAMVLLAMLALIPRLRDDWEVYAVSFFGTICAGFVPLWYFQGIEKMQEVTYAQLVTRALSVAGIFLFVKQPGDVVKAVAVQGAASFLSLVLCSYIMTIVSPVSLVLPKAPDIAQSLKSGWRIFSSTMVTTLYMTTNLVLVGSFGGKEAAGYYGAADKLTSAVRLLLNPFRQALFPHFTRLAAEAPMQARLDLKRVVVVLGLGFGLASLLLAVFSSQLVNFLYGPEFGRSAKLVLIMSPVPLLVAVSTCFAVFFMLGFGFHTQWQRLIFSAAVVNYCVLGALMLVMSYDVAVASTAVIVEGYMVTRGYLFYRKYKDNKFPITS